MKQTCTKLVLPRRKLPRGLLAEHEGHRRVPPAAQLFFAVDEGRRPVEHHRRVCLEVLHVNQLLHIGQERNQRLS